MADKRNPTNADILEEFKSVSSLVSNMDGRLQAVEKWQFGEDIARKAVENYKAQENGDGRGKTTNSINKELVKSLLIALGIISTLVGIWAAKS